MRVNPEKKGPHVSEEQRAAESQADASSEGQEPTTQEQPQQEESQVDESSADTPQAEGEANKEMVPLSELKKLRKENQTLRNRTKQFEKQEEEKRQAQLSETQQLQEENGTLKSELESLSAQVKRANFAQQFKLPDAELAWGEFADMVEWTDDNTASNMEDIVKEAKKRYPRVWGNGSSNGGERTEAAMPQGSDFVNSLFRGGQTPRRRR